MATTKNIFFVLLALSHTTLFGQINHDSVYIFSYFKNNGQDGLHLAYSYDGYNFKALNHDSSFLRPTAGKDKLMRDPCIVRGVNGIFHMVWTVSWNERGVGYANSPDLLYWSEQNFIPVMENEDSARNCWAPEIIFDPGEKQYMIYWATTISGKYFTGTSAEKGYNHRIYYVTTKNFKQLGKTQLLYDPGFNVIDANIVRDGERWIMFLMDETLTPVAQKNIRIATGKELTKNYRKASRAITGNYWAEGPTAIRIGGNWIVYFDKYREHSYGAVTSKDLITWTDISDKVVFPDGTRHGTIFLITRDEFNKLISQ